MKETRSDQHTNLDDSAARWWMRGGEAVRGFSKLGGLLLRQMVFLPVVVAVAGAADPVAPQNPPPIIDREWLFGNPEYSGAQLSPDGRYIAFLKPWNGTRNIWVKKAAAPFTSATLLTAETKRPLSEFFWTRDGRHILFVKDRDGDENFNVYAVDPAAAPVSGSEAPPAHDLTGVTGAQVRIYAVPKQQPGTIFIGLNDRDTSWHDLYQLDLATGQKTLIRRNTDQLSGWLFDLAGRLRLATRTTSSGEQEILRVDVGGTFTRIYQCGVFDECEPIRFHKDGRRVYLETNKETNLSELALLDVRSGAITPVESDPLQRVDFGYPIFSEATEELVATTYLDDRRRVYFKDPQYEADYTWLQQQKPGRQVTPTGSTADDRQWIVGFTSDTEPGETYLFNRAAKQLTRQYRIREKVDRAALSPMTVVRYRSSDGLEIPAYLTLPLGWVAKDLPLVVMPHGGPWSRDQWGYNAAHQFLANRGYAVLSPNFRGSTGFGKAFLNAGNGEWGRNMQDDITWGVKHVVAAGIADAARIGIMGGSYGGYATLAGVAFTPELYRAGVDIVGPSNLVTLMEAIPPYWESFRKIMIGRMADPASPEGRQWLTERSPLNSVAAITTPLLVVQGANDPRVAKREADQIVAAVRDRGCPVEYLLAPDEGHGFARPVNSLAMWAAVERFLATHLHGRYQEGGTPEVMGRLAEITVDPRTVTLQKELISSAPASTESLNPGASVPSSLCSPRG